MEHTEHVYKVSQMVLVSGIHYIFTALLDVTHSALPAMAREINAKFFFLSVNLIGELHW